MYLSRLNLKRFRSCWDTTVVFRDDLTVLVGENNSGKSNIIDSLRILTMPLNGRRDRYPEDEDLSRGAPEKRFVIEGQFERLSPTQKGLLIQAVLDPTKDCARFGMYYEHPSEKHPRGKSVYWVGANEETEPEPGSTDLIRHVYLPPLRDAHQALGSSGARRIHALLRYFLDDQKEKAFKEAVKRPKDSTSVLEDINTQIGDTLAKLTRGVRKQVAALDFADEELLDIARDLRFKLADEGVDLQEIRSSGLGYANLLYMATVVVELARAREADLTLFLVEEPEAHLHPQLQLIVLDFLREEAAKIRQRPKPTGHPEGLIQIIVTTHSPNLTAWISPEHLVVVRSRRDESTRSFWTCVVPVADLRLTRAEVRKVSRYLDVTRSAVLYGNRVILVEGIAEAILLPVLAKKFVLRSDVEAYQRFRASIIVPIDGVDFAPYVKVLLRTVHGVSIADRVVVITDSDPQVPGNRKRDLEEIAEKENAANRLHVYTNTYTLEYELFLAGNEALLKRVFLSLHPNSEAQWATVESHANKEERARAFLRLLKVKRTRKGDFAQQLAEFLESESNAEFTVPDYLERAIRKAAEP